MKQRRRQPKPQPYVSVTPHGATETNWVEFARANGLATTAEPKRESWWDRLWKR